MWCDISCLCLYIMWYQLSLFSTMRAQIQYPILRLIARSHQFWNPGDWVWNACITLKFARSAQVHWQQYWCDGKTCRNDFALSRLLWDFTIRSVLQYVWISVAVIKYRLYFELTKWIQYLILMGVPCTLEKNICIVLTINCYILCINILQSCNNCFLYGCCFTWFLYEELLTERDRCLKSK